MSAAKILISNITRRPRGLYLHGGVWHVDVMRRGRRLHRSTGTTDLNTAIGALEKALAEIAPSGETTEFQQPRRHGAPIWPQLPTGTDEASLRLRAEMLASEQWARRVRGMIDGLKRGKTLAMVAAAYDLDYIEALQWMCDHRKAWVAELLDGVATRRRT